MLFCVVLISSGHKQPDGSLLFPQHRHSPSKGAKHPPERTPCAVQTWDCWPTDCIWKPFQLHKTLNFSISISEVAQWWEMLQATKDRAQWHCLIGAYRGRKMILRPGLQWWTDVDAFSWVTNIFHSHRPHHHLICSQDLHTLPLAQLLNQYARKSHAPIKMKTASALTSAMTTGDLSFFFFFWFRLEHFTWNTIWR